MKENVCMKCGRRSCSFRSYNTEECPYAPKLPQLYELDSESSTEKATADSWQKVNPLIKHFQIKEHAIDFDASKITRRLMAGVIDTADAVIVNEIRKEAERQGFTDLYLIDRELVKKVITGATPRRGQWRYIFNRPRHAPIACTLVCNACDAQTERIVGAVFNYCPNCGAKMDE